MIEFFTILIVEIIFAGEMKKIIILLSLFVLIPALFYASYQIYSLNETEDLLMQSYTQQMETILFSINQYCLDVVNSWVGKILVENEPDIEKNINFIVNRVDVIEAIALSDANFDHINLFLENSAEGHSDLSINNIREMLRNNNSSIERLKHYQKQNYQKLEPLVLDKTPAAKNRFIVLAFILPQGKGNAVYGTVFIRKENFFYNIISPKIDELTGNSIELIIFDGNKIFSRDSNQATYSSDFKLNKKLWILPDTYIGIRLNGQTIEELAASRFNKNLALVLFIELFIIIIAIWVYRITREKIELANMKSVFVSNVSHELRTPLALIRMYAETLEMDRIKDDSKRKEYYHIISSEAERLSHLVNNILNFSRMESGKKTYQMEELDINQIIESVYENYCLKFQESGFTCQLELSEKDPKINGDRESVTSAIINLMDNAIKYSTDNKKIIIRSVQKENSTTVEIKDHGIGIKPEDRKKIFEKFYRVADGLVHNTKGSGLGLTIVYHIMEAHNGTVEVESELNKGSLFRLVFPKNNQ